MRRSSSGSFGKCGFAAVLICAAAGLTGCAANGGLPDPGVDPLVTAATPTTPKLVEDDRARDKSAAQTDENSDALTISGAVASVAITDKPVNWANPATGSTGFIHGVIESRRADGSLCRSFSALRTSYDGVRNYDGAICMSGAGQWRIAKFDAA
jgi:hypothetical protein